MNIDKVSNLMRQMAEFLEYHSLVLENETPYVLYGSAVTSIGASFDGACIHLNEEAFDRVIKNPQVVMDYGCDPLGVEVTVNSSKTMRCSFMWNDIEVMCLKDLDLSKVTKHKDKKSSVGVA